MGSGFESQGAHFKENPADSSESAGFLRSLVNTVLRALRSRGSALFLMVRAACFLRAYAGAPVTRTLRPSLLRCGERPCDTLRALPENAARYRGAVLLLSVSVVQVFVESRRFVGSRGGFVCAPCLANWGGGGLSRFGVLRAGCSGARRGVGAVRSDIRVPEAKRGRVPL